jgi:hypothetical protein
MNTIFPLILLYYLNHLLFKFDFFQKIAWNANNSLNVANDYKNQPNCNMMYHMLYVLSRKNSKWEDIFRGNCIWDLVEISRWEKNIYRAHGKLSSAHDKGF